MNLPRLFTRQYNLGVGFGGLRILVSSVIAYVSLVNFVLICVIAYNTTLRAAIQPHLPWFNFPTFIGIAAGFFLIAIILEYKFVVPSTTTYGNLQGYKHRNPIRKDLELIIKKLEKIEKEISKK